MSDLSSAFDAAERERLVDEFRACLERAASGSAAAGDDRANDTEEAPVSVDLATLLSEMAVLKNELRLQSRQFKNTLDELRQFGNDLREHSERLQRELERAREHAVSVERQTAQPFLLALLDLRDRLQSGADAAGRPPSSLLSRLVPGPTRFAASLAEGQRLTLQRLDDFLASHRVRAIPAEGEAFDAQRMRVVGLESGDEASGVPEGTVLREVRRGFVHHGELLRFAEVIVSKKANRT
jgi:molecular chaperone GrpE